nr:hypothetical protein BaRGS_014459 [Batillaria attramentaria]
MGVDFLGKYNNWDKVDPASGADYLVLWLDCDKEGENICFEVIECVQHVMNRVPGQQVYRAKFSAITDTEVKAAFNNLGQPNKNEALSVDARQELDLRIGCAFTRFQTKFFQGKYGDLDSSLISYGPCQTPTLGFCVERHDKIQSFKPEPYWVINTQVKLPDGKTLKLDWERVRVFDKEVAQMFVNLIKSGDKACVLETVQKKMEKPKPLALNTVEMLRVGSSGLGMSPHHTMQIAERLYIQGYISYPRTETNSYPDSFDLRGTLKQQADHPDWGPFVRKVLKDGMKQPKKGHDAGDHPPITPMRSARQSDFDPDSWRLYDYITRHFIATLSPNCLYLQTTVYFEIGPERFSCSGKVLTDPGFTEVMPWLALGADEEIPTLKQNTMLDIDEVKLVDRQTSPPDYLTESELISLMEKHGIGTDASIPVHINNIVERRYVNIIGGRRLQPTSLGIVLVHGYQRIDADLVLSTMRSAVEQQLNLIAQGRADFHEVKQHTVDIFHLKFRYFVQHINAMDELFEVTFSSLADSGRPISRCGKCRRYMKLVEAKPARLFCSTCDTTYSLPQNGNIKLYKELRCPLDEFELLLWTTGAKGKSYPLCPYCYNNPPFKDMRKGMGCNECSHPTCPHAYSQNGVSECVECERGILVLDQTSAPKWKMACNKCNVVIHFFDNALKVAVHQEMCDDCGASKIEVGFKTQGTGRGKPKDKMAQLAAYFV